MFKRLKKISLIGLFLAAVSFAGMPIVQAQINTGVEFGAASGLGGGDIRTTIARIIQVFLGILGIVALILIIYAGFLWMTAGGDEEKVTRAKRIMTQAIIGLIIVLSSFAITTFIVSRLVAATTGTEGGGNNGGGGGGGGLGTGTFTVDAITPPGDKPADFLWPKNSLVRVVLKNGIPDPATVPGSVSVTANGTPVSGTISAAGNALVFTATAPCAENPAYTCLPGNATFTVTVSPTVMSVSGKALFCGKCSASFATNDLIDTQNPTVSIISPSDGASVSTNVFVPVVADAADDSAVAQVEFFANDVSLGSSGSAPWQIDWDTTGIPAGTAVTLKAKATDAVGNSTLANPVTVTVRPAHCFNNVVDGGETGLNCGDGCGACAGGSCSVNSDCSSGLCQNGVCVNRPRIDGVAPLSGGPGTLVTISGSSFGSAPGEIMFLGATAAGDEKAAAPCAPAAWTDTQVIVTLPEGAVSGPIQITNRDNLSDRTDDDFGNVSIPNFTVNTTVRPGICTITPSSGASGVSVDVLGTGFGDVQGAGGISVAGRSADVKKWSGSIITMAVPNLLGGTWPVIVTAAGVDSNGAAFSVPVSANTAPRLTSIEPSSGPVGEYVTILGSNFGNTPGKVNFTSGADTVIGRTDFPAACGNDFWHDNSITVKVPSGLPEGAVKVSVARSDAPSDNSLDFTIVPGSPKPGICRINPTSGPSGTPYEVDGERLGKDKGKIFFRDNVEATSAISSWDDNSVHGLVPTKAVTGRVFVVSAGADSSNSLNFTVADCRQSSICSGSQECCTDGTCREPNADGSSGCAAPRLSGSYRYRFSTGDIPLVPAVVEDVSCAVRSQSPSPYKDVADACVNSVLTVRFTIPMDASTLVAGNVAVSDCGGGDQFDAANCGSPVAGTVLATGGGQTLDDGLVFTPQADLKPNEWYRGTILKTVKSAGGVPMNDDYVWHFRVRNSAAACAIESITVAPAVNRLTDLYVDANREGSQNKTYTEYKANPANATCNELKCESYAWNWNSDMNAAQVVNPSVCTPEVRALSETPVATPATISATAMTKTGTGSLTVKFVDPQVIDEWPNCQAACLEAQVAASFNTAIGDASSDTVKFLKCNNETCLSPAEISGYTVSAQNNGSEHLAVIHPPVNADGTILAANTFYRVVVLGGTSGVHSLSGASLVGTNYAYGPDRAPSYSWVFRTSDNHCQINSVTTTPDKVVTSLVGSAHTITAVPKTAPDSCSQSGERIDTDSLDFAWSFAPNPAGAAVLYQNGTLNVQPLQSAYATASCLNTGTVAGLFVCGNGKLEKGEECDDANTADGDGCSHNCLLEGFPDTCGNGKIDSKTLANGTVVSEQCDDGNKVDGDGCSSKCLREGSPFGSHPSICGNNSVGDNEQCDDGNAVSGDGCSSICLDEGSQPGPLSVCGNKIKEAGEDCDLGAQNGKSGSGCSASCLFTGAPSCNVAGGSNCCGDGKPAETGKDPGCDLGWDNVNKKPIVAQGCDATCRKTGASLEYAPPSVCGDGVVGVGETYDPGTPNGSKIDASQFAIAVGGPGGSVDTNGRMVSQITAAVGDRKGQTEFDLQCGFKSDAACPAGTYLGSNSCCYPRANVVSFSPQGANACRNPLIQVEFDRPMDGNSLAGKFTVTGPMPASGTCPAIKVSVGPFHKLWLEIAGLFTKIIAFITGRPAMAQASTCSVPGTVAVENISVNGSLHSFVRFSLQAALDPKAPYSVKIDQAAKTADGVPLAGPVTWNFTTGTDICTLDAINVDPPSALLTAVYAGFEDPNADQSFRAHAVHLDDSGAASDIAPVVGVYAWQTAWSSSNPALVNATTGNLPTSSDTATAAVKKAENGQVTLGATATITADTLNASSTKDRIVQGTADITVMLCKHPWPARNSVDGSWSPAYDSVYKYSFYYCRDNAEGNAGLPELIEKPVIPANTDALKAQKIIINQYLYTYSPTSSVINAALASEGVGLRIAANPLHLSPTEWYAAQGFKGKIAPVKVDGYEAVRDGRTIYVSAPSIDTGSVVNGTDDFTNIFSWSYSEGAGADTQNIFKQITSNLRFVAQPGVNPTYFDLNVCSTDSTIGCASDLDCSVKTPGSTCLNARSKIRRDVKRLADLRLIAAAAQRTKDSSGAYPQLASGSFLPGRSVSVWPSWNAAFAQGVGGTPPTDPVNKLGVCSGTGIEASTCWSASNQTFVCPAGSRVYAYYQTPTYGFSLNFNKESGADFVGNYCRVLARPACQADPWCNFDAMGNCTSRLNAIDACVGNQLGPKAGVCGNGVIESGEGCEVGVQATRQSLTCPVGSLGTDNCGADCQWVLGTCKLSKCGDGIVEPGEVCDNGALNGTYGHCNAACSGIGQSCGDGLVEQGEVCDNGLNGKTAGGIVYPPNGVWSAVPGRSCSFDCHSLGDFCGDNKVSPSGSEQCDGNSQSSVNANGALPACPNTADGRPQAYTQTCNATCKWNDWGSCMPVGSCGNGTKESNEQCDQGAGNSDNGQCLSNCHVASCGDGRVWTGHEQCDNGAANLDPNTPTGQAAILAKRQACSLASCYYCTNVCTVEAVSGAYCGDGNIDAPLGETCDKGANNVDPNNAAVMQALQAKCNAGDANACNYCNKNTCQVIATPHCGDSHVDNGEGCDLGTQNGIVGSSCSTTCQCLAETFVSGDGKDSIVDANGNILSPAVTQNDGFAAIFSPAYWAPLAPAKYIWSFDETNTALAPPDWGSNDSVVYFKKTFSTAKASKSMTLEMTADNNIDQVWVDGQDITAAVGTVMNNFSVVYALDITKYLKPGLSHTVMFKARDVHNFQPVLQNPAMLIFRIISNPDCGGNQVGYAPSCGNGLVDTGEQCDGRNLNGKNDCKALGSYDIGSLSCKADCTYSTSNCQSCLVMVSGKIVDSQSSKGVSGMPVQALCGTTPVASATTGAGGVYSLGVPNSAGALAACAGKITIASANVQTYCFDATSQQVSVDLSGLAASCTGSAAANNLVMTQMPDPGKYTFVLTWNPIALDLNTHMKLKDLDASHQAACWYSEAKDSSGRHIITPCQFAATTPDKPRRCVVNGALDANQVCNSNDDCAGGAQCACLAVDNGNVFLDIDAKSGPGPETITVTAHDGIRGAYYIDGTGNGSSSATAPFSGSGAKAQIWGYGCTMLSYDVTKAVGYPSGGAGWWEITNFAEQPDGSLLFTPRGGPNGQMGTAPQPGTDPALACP